MIPVAFDREVLLSARFGKDYIDKLLEKRVDDEDGFDIKGAPNNEEISPERLNEIDWDNDDELGF